MISEAARNLFEELAPLGPAERAARIERARLSAGGTPTPAAEIEEVCSLLETLDRSPRFLDSPTIEWRSEGGAPLPLYSRGTRFGSYTLIREVGRGGMGVVFEAEQDRPRRRVALKLMKPGPHSRSELARFKREAEALGLLHHPNIAAIHEAWMAPPGAADGQASFIAMEFVKGRTIVEHARSEGLDVRGVVRLMADACDAVAHTHARNVIHRDLSPSNILVDESGGVKIVDFGVAAMMGGDCAATLATTGHHVFGKWAYMSPEQAAGGLTRTDGRTDVFSIGAVLYELLAGRPWLDAKGKSVIQLSRAVEREEPVPIGSICRAAKGGLEDVIAMAMRKERARRYQSVADLRDELRRWLNGERVHAHREGPIERVGRFAAQNRLLVGSIAAVFVALTLGLAAASWQWSRAVRNESRATRNKAQLREVVRSVLQNVVAAMSRTRYSVEARAGALREVRPAVEQLLAASPDDPEARVLAAKYYTEIAMVEGYPYTANRGSRDAAIENFRRAIAVAAPSGLDAIVDEACAEAAVRAWNLHEGTLRYCRRSREREDLARLILPATADWLDRGANRSSWIFLHAWTIASLSLRHMANGSGDLSQPLLEGIVGTLYASISSVATDMDAKQIGNAMLTVAVASSLIGRWEVVPELCERARPLLKRWAESPGADPDDWLNLLDTYRHQSRGLRSNGRPSEAFQPAAASLLLARELAARFPERMNMAIALKMALIEQGEVRAALLDPAATDDFEEAVRVSRTTTADGGSSGQIIGRICQPLAMLAEAAMDLRRAGLATDLRGRDLLDVARAAIREVEDLLPQLESSEHADEIRRMVASLRAQGV